MSPFYSIINHLPRYRYIQNQCQAENPHCSVLQCAVLSGREQCVSLLLNHQPPPQVPVHSEPMLSREAYLFSAPVCSVERQGAVCLPSTQSSTTSPGTVPVHSEPVLSREKPTLFSAPVCSVEWQGAVCLPSTQSSNTSPGTNTFRTSVQQRSSHCSVLQCAVLSGREQCVSLLLNHQPPPHVPVH